MVLSGYTQFTPDTKEGSSTPPASAPPQYTTIYPGFGTNTTFPGAPQPLYPTIPQVPQLQQQPGGLWTANGQLFNPFGTNPFGQPTAPESVTTQPGYNTIGQPEVPAQSEVVGNSSAAGSTAAQIVNYSITYYAPQEIDNVHTEFINCCEDCCEDCCENWCLNCCLDCSKLTNALFGGNTAAATNVTTPGQLSNSTTPSTGSTSLVWDSVPLTGSTGSTFTLGNGLGTTPLLKK